MTPLTPAGQALLVGFGAGRDYPGRDDINDRLQRAVREVQRQAADRALAELRREVESVTLYDGFAETRADAAESIRGRILALIDKASKPEKGL